MLKFILGNILALFFMGSAFAVPVPEPQHSPSVGGRWVAYTNDDSSSGHVSNAKYSICFIYTGHHGTHDVYKTFIFGSDGFRGQGIARQEGDQVSLLADENSHFDRHLTSQWDLVEGPKTEKLMGSGHWVQWGNSFTIKPSVQFRNVRYNKISNNCVCLDKECTVVELEENF